MFYNPKPPAPRDKIDCTPEFCNIVRFLIHPEISRSFCNCMVYVPYSLNPLQPDEIPFERLAEGLPADDAAKIRRAIEFIEPVYQGRRLESYERKRPPVLWSGRRNPPGFERRRFQKASTGFCP